MNILFICKYNRFRSKTAEAFFKSMYKGKTHKVKSAGIIRGSPVSKEIQQATKAFNIKINTKPKGLTTTMLKWHNLAIIVADDVPKAIFADSKRYGKKVLVWKVPDSKSNNLPGMNKSIKIIQEKVKEFVETLE